MREKLRALPYFINNLAPGIRASWIALSRRPTVMQSAKDDLSRLGPSNPVRSNARPDVVAVVLDADGVLLGAIEPNGSGERAIISNRSGANAAAAMNPAPQTIRPDMTHKLAATLLKQHRYILVTTSLGKYIGRYEPPPT
jgi:hypothetical protein